MNLKDWFRSQYPALFPEETDNVVLENKICSLFQRVKEKEDTILPRMSKDFDTRLFNLLESVTIDKPNQKISFTFRDLIENRTVQYSFSAVMALSLVFILVSRSSQEPTLAGNQDTAGVVIEQNNYQYEPTSLDLNESYQKRVLLDRLRSAPGAVYGLRELELYYEKTGRESSADELRLLIESVER
ncbi:hypothetical protein EHQ68_01430 [Leptospira congkakensis]|uniref:Uncharacterized protein n=1 Tax=Leptospira congkakensis TaxID=2484932 RepID=A0A4Z1AN74_9LEPT|nr:hypothetical protein [Leptospira congkakensis]TGL90983.1 hypothetical protein EHQ69_09195 [Leptospira congkakensis]TGL91993.1 hypothetical protein EHQ68_01430 [Leptospira congkakensis]TGL99041.1 hypothetical protein EHQ70_01020 [Leptospira congkakensis]